MDITTNRVDAMNHYGIAREAATIYNLPLTPLDTALPAAQPAARPFPVEIAIEAQNLCGRFTARVLRNVDHRALDGPGRRVLRPARIRSPSPMQSTPPTSCCRAWAIPPTPSTWTRSTVESSSAWRAKANGSSCSTGPSARWTPTIWSSPTTAKPLGLAGVMGGWDSMITAETKNILVEAAWFDPASVRRSARRHGLHTDASHRFERGADFNACAVANALVAKLILQSGGAPEGELVDIVSSPAIAARTAARPPIALSLAQVQRHLGRDARRPARPIRAHRRTGPPVPHRPRLHTDPQTRLQPSDLQCQAAELAARPRTRDRPGRRGCARLRIQPLRQHAAHRAACRRASAGRRGVRCARAPAGAWLLGGDLQQLRVRGRRRNLRRRKSASAAQASSRWRIRSPTRHVCCAHRWRRECLPCSPTTSTATCARCVSSSRARSSPAQPSRSSSRPASRWGSLASCRATRLHSAKDAAVFELKGVIESLLSLFAVSPDALSTSAASALTFSAEAPSWLEPGRSCNGLARRHAHRLLRRTGRLPARDAQAAPACLPRRARPRCALPPASAPRHRARTFALPGRRARLLLHLRRCRPVAHHRRGNPRA